MKERLDVLLVKKGLAASREKAKAIIMSGVVFVDGQREDKAGTMVKEELPIEIKGKTLKYGQPGRAEARKGNETVQYSAYGQGMHGCWSVHWRFYPLHALKRCQKGIFC